MKQKQLSILLLLSLYAMTSSCVKKEKANTIKSNTGYFSIKKLAQDQFHNFGGQPFAMEKIVTLNGKTDSTNENAYTLNWGNILSIFFESDISDPKYVGQYNFSSFEDNSTGSLTYYYEAKDNKLYTRSLQIVTDPFTNRVKSVYIETAKKSRFSEKSQKLLYVPLKIIQIQEFESSFLSKDKNLRIEYRFVI